MRLLIAVLLSAGLLVLAHPKPPAHIYKQVDHTVVTKAVTKVATPVTPTMTVQPQPVQQVTQTVSQPVTPTYANGCSTYDSIFRQYAWNVTVAEAICMAESGGSVYAVSSTDDYGLMQLHDEEIFNPSANIAGAYQKYLSQGWEAWTTYNTGAYYKYL